MPNLYWAQTGGCGGDTLSIMNMTGPSLDETLRRADIDVLYHPSLSVMSARDHLALVDQLADGDLELDFLCVEGSIITGPADSGLYSTDHHRPHQETVAALAPKARYVIALGTCACYGGPDRACHHEDATGLQYFGKERGGFLGEDFQGLAGTPVINLPACPVNPEPVKDTLLRLSLGDVPELDMYGRPEDWHGFTVHQGCTRNEYHEYRCEEFEFGRPGCLFFGLGCRGPMTYSHCNRVLWNGVSSKPRAGVPCMGCTGPDFPGDAPFMVTPNVAGLPLVLPDGVSRAHYLAYKDLAAEAAPERLINRRNKV